LIHLRGRKRDKLKSGDSVSRLTSDVEIINGFITSVLAEGLGTIVGTLGAVVLMLMTNMRLGLTLLAVIPLALVVLAVVGGSLTRYSEKAQEDLGEAGTVASETIDAIETVQAFNRQELRHAEYKTALSRYYRSTMGMTLRYAIMILVVSIIIFCGLTLVLWLGARLVVSQTITPGELTTLVLYAVFAGTGFAQIGEIFGDTMEAIGASSRLQNVHSQNNLSGLIAKENAPIVNPRALKFEDVEFSYDDGADKALQDFNLEVMPGEFLALVGPSGAGKSTVLKLAMGLYEPDEGQISLGGVSLTNADIKDWIEYYAYVPQNPELFTGTARYNIAFGRADADDAQLELAARRSQAWEFLEPIGGLDASLGNKAKELSGGQRQRILIARAMAKPAEFLLLDEATSSLDSLSEQFVQKALNEIAKNTTLIVVAHRLSTVQQADRIVVIEDGRVVEQGKHKELLKKNGLYTQLASYQFIK